MSIVKNLLAVAVMTAFASSALAQNLAGTVLSQRKISATQGGLTATLSSPGLFGVSVAKLGDLDGDGNQDIAVGSYVDSEFVPYSGALYILFLKHDGSVKSYSKIGSNHAGFNVTLNPLDMFGWSVCNMGDLDGDGVIDLAVGSWLDDSGGLFDNGAIYVLFMKKDGTVKANQKITMGQGGLPDVLQNENRFGTSLTNLGDLDGDGVNDLLAGAIYDNDAAYLAGSCFTLFMKSDGTVKASQKITMGQGGFFTILDHQDRFGYASTNIGDLDGDGVTDVAVSSFLDNDGGQGNGCVWILFMQTDGYVKSYTKITDVSANFQGPISTDDSFGSSVAALPDMNGDGIQDLAVGTIADDTGGSNRGAVYILFLQHDGTVNGHCKIGNNLGGFGPLDNDDRFGQATCFLGDIDGDGIPELAVGADHDDDGGSEVGAIYLASLATSRWSQTGNPTSTVIDPPRLAASGPLTAGSTVTVTMKGGLPGALSMWFVNAGHQSLPAAGTWFIPDLNSPGTAFTIPLDATGKATITSTWPAGIPALTDFYMQAATIGTPLSRNHMALTNGIHGVAN